MTTLQRSLDTSLAQLPLNTLSLEEAWELLTELAGAERISKDDVWAQHVVSILCEWLGYLPLGLELVGRYLAESPHMSLGEMLKRLQAHRLEDAAINSSNPEIPKTLSTAKRGVKAAFELIWQKLDLITQQVAEFLSLFAPEVIPWKLVESASQRMSWGKSDLNRAKTQLHKWQLIQSVDSRKDYYKLHPLIREFLQTKLAASERAHQVKRTFIEIMVFIAQQIPDSPNPEEIEIVKDAIPHLQEVTQTLTDVVKDEELLWLCDRLGSFYKGQGLYDLAKPWFVRCLSVAKVCFGNDHPDVATTLNNLAGVYYAQGRYQKAESLYLQALKMRRYLLGVHSPEVATTLNNLALLYYYQKRYDEAEPLYLEALELRKRFRRSDSLDVAATLNNLGLLYYAQGRYGEAEPLYLEALEGRKRLLGTNHIDVATTLNNLASLYGAQGRYQDAKIILEQALEVSEPMLGSTHPHIIIFRKNLQSLQTKLESSHPWLPQNLTKNFLTFVQRLK